LFVTYTINDKIMYQPFSISSILGQLNQIGSAQPLTVPQSFRLSSWSYAAIKGQGYVLGNDNNTFVLYGIQSSYNLVLLTSGVLTNDADATLTVLSLLSPNVSALGDEGELWIFSVSSSASCSIAIQIWRIGTESPYSLSPLGPSVCAISNGDVVTIASSVDVLGAGVHACGEQNIGGIVLSSSSTRVISAFYFCLDPITVAMNLSNWNSFGMGSNARVSIHTILDDTRVMIVGGESFCYNNEVQNKRASPLLCSSLPSSTPNILTYTYGTFDELVSQIDSGEMSTPCSTHVLHGMYDMGTRPSVALYSLDSSLGVVEVHEGIPSSVDPGSCGVSNTFRGIVLDGWHLVP